jgi:hypothetical protein
VTRSLRDGSSGVKWRCTSQRWVDSVGIEPIGAFVGAVTGVVMSFRILVRSLIVAVVVSLTAAIGVAAPAQADKGNKGESWSSQFTKKNGWHVWYGKRTSAWIVANEVGGLAIPKKRSSKRVSLSAASTNRESRDVVQSYVVNFTGFDRQGPVDVEFVETSKTLPVQAFKNIANGQVFDINVDMGDGTPCSDFFVIVKDQKGNWAIGYVSVLHNGVVASPGLSG